VLCEQAIDLADGLLQAIDRAHVHHPLHVLAGFEPQVQLHPCTEQFQAMLTVSVQEDDIADVRPVFGKQAE
jgi:hypothetical protein